MKSSPAISKPATRGASLAGLSFRYLLLFLVVLGGGSLLPSLDNVGTFELWHDLRFRRLVYAAAVGALLALSGTVFQAVLRNPLAEPYILGISGASALGAVVARLIVPLSVGALTASTLFTLGPLVGAILGILLLIGLSRWAGLYDPPSLILSGAVLNAIFGALILLFYSIAPERQVVSSLLWLMGNIQGQAILGTAALPLSLGAVVVSGLGFAAVARYLDLLSLGEEEAGDLGIAPRSFRIAMLVGASLLTGIVVSSAGPIGFIGLVVPHVMRRLHGPSHRRLIPLSMFGGAIFLMLCDTVARSALDRPIPIGVITALVGGPFFLFLLGTYRRGEQV